MIDIKKVLALCEKHAWAVSYLNIFCSFVGSKCSFRITYINNIQLVVFKIQVFDIICIYKNLGWRPYFLFKTICIYFLPSNVSEIEFVFSSTFTVEIIISFRDETR